MGNKSILMSIQPRWVAEILNGNKTIEVRKKFPKDYVGWVYIYCTKNGKDINDFPTELVDYRGCAIYNRFQLMYKGHKLTTDDNKPRINGKVVARFWCDKVSIIERYCGGFIPINGYTTFLDKRYSYEGLKQATFLSDEELYRYLGNKNGYAIHISKLEVFDKPEELKEFYFQENCANCPHKKYCKAGSICKHDLHKAPSSWCYVERKGIKI